jgi:branched-chain amino acid transport system ATP-binding protein
MSWLLSAQGVQKKFGAVVAAQDLHINIQAGERISLIGSNGAGKTTFVNMITGYIQPDAGQIALDGHNIIGMTPRDITRLGVARSFQIPQLYASMSVLDNMLVAQTTHDNQLSWWRPAHSAASCR